MCKRANSTVALQEVWVQEMNLYYVHNELTGDVDQPHNLEKQQHQKVTETINMVTKNKFQVPNGYKGTLHIKGHAVNKLINEVLQEEKTWTDYVHEQPRW